VATFRFLALPGFSAVVVLVFLACPSAARAQVSNLELNPSPASTLDSVEASFVFLWFAKSQTFEIETEVSGPVVTIDILLSGQPFGGPLIAFFRESFGPLAPGEYDVVVNYRVDDELLDSETETLLVQPVRAVPMFQSPYLLGLFALLLLAAVAVGKTT